MSDLPRDRWEFWIRFICAFLFFGVVVDGKADLSNLSNLPTPKHYPNSTKISLGLAPSPGPMMPRSSRMSIMRAARP